MHSGWSAWARQCMCMRMRRKLWLRSLCWQSIMRCRLAAQTGRRVCTVGTLFGAGRVALVDRGRALLSGCPAFMAISPNRPGCHTRQTITPATHENRCGARPRPLASMHGEGTSSLTRPHLCSSVRGSPADPSRPALVSEPSMAGRCNGQRAARARRCVPLLSRPCLGSPWACTAPPRGRWGAAPSAGLRACTSGVSPSPRAPERST